MATIAMDSVMISKSNMMFLCSWQDQIVRLPGGFFWEEMALPAKAKGFLATIFEEEWMKNKILTNPPPPNNDWGINASPDTNLIITAWALGITLIDTIMEFEIMGNENQKWSQIQK